MDQKARWELEGELLEVSLTFDALRRKTERTAAEEATLQDAEKRRALIERRLREGCLRGG